MATKRTGVACYEKAGLDEPVFVLRAQDLSAPSIVRDWALAAELSGVNAPKVQEALECADQMEAWQELNGKKVPD